MKRAELGTREGGFTLLELLFAIILSAILLAGMYSVFTSQQAVYTAQEGIVEMNQNIRAVLDLMTREIRLAGYKRDGSTLNGIATAQPSTIRILADLDQDGDILDTKEDITYSYDAGSRQIWRNGVNLPVAENIINLVFVYTMADGTTTSTPASVVDIRKVTITVTARTPYPDQSTGQHRTMTLTSDVTPRNLIS